MDTQAVEELLRKCIEERLREGIAVRSARTADIIRIRTAEPVAAGVYWSPDDPTRPLCLIGATKSENQEGAMQLLGLSLDDVRNLEYGFENWWLVDRDSPFYKLGRQLGEELEAYECRNYRITPS